MNLQRSCVKLSRSCVENGVFFGTMKFRGQGEPSATMVDEQFCITFYMKIVVQ
jgi:hypothetical protein